MLWWFYTRQISQHSQLNQHHASRTVGLSALLTSNLRLIIILCAVSVWLPMVMVDYLP